MSYKEQIRKRIRELEAKIAESDLDRIQLESLRSELARTVEHAEFVETNVHTESQQLLKG